MIKKDMIHIQIMYTMQLDVVEDKIKLEFEGRIIVVN